MTESPKDKVTREENAADAKERQEKNLAEFTNDYCKMRIRHDAMEPKLDKMKGKVLDLLHALKLPDWVADSGAKMSSRSRKNEGFEDEKLKRFLLQKHDGKYTSASVTLTAPTAKDLEVMLEAMTHDHEFEYGAVVVGVDYEALEGAVYEGDFSAKLLKPFRTLSVTSYVQFTKPPKKKG